jgi:hypothetical protein
LKFRASASGAISDVAAIAAAPLRIFLRLSELDIAAG